MTEESVFRLSIHIFVSLLKEKRKKRNMFWFVLRCCIFVFIERLNFVSWLFSGCMLSEWSACWQREKSSLWSLRLTNRKQDRDKPEALKVPGAVMRRRLQASHCDLCACVCVCVWSLCLYMHVCLCGPPEAANRGRMEVLLIISP